jgi:hypothetical protein
MRTLIFDLFAVAGLALFTVGAGWIYRPLALIVPGLAFVALGVFGAYVFDQRDRVNRRNQK